MNTVSITGRITHDLSLKETKTKKHVMDFQVAIRETKEISTFVRCQAWEQDADFLDRYAVKGSLVAVTGSLKTEKYQDKNGNNIERTYVRVFRIEILDHRKEEVQKQNEQFGYQTPVEENGDFNISPDELPFY